MQSVAAKLEERHNSKGMMYIAALHCKAVPVVRVEKYAPVLFILFQ